MCVLSAKCSVKIRGKRCQGNPSLYIYHARKVIQSLHPSLKPLLTFGIDSVEDSTYLQCLESVLSPLEHTSVTLDSWILRFEKYLSLLLRQDNS